MTLKELEKLLKKCGGQKSALVSRWVIPTDAILKVAAEIAKREREECAKVCEKIDEEYEHEDVLATWCAAAIRARGKA
jgi:hypothetical protein